MVDEFSRAVGAVLRDARRARSLTLRDVQRATRGRYPVSTVAGYERAERSPSLARFCELAGVYGVAPESMLADVLAAVAREAAGGDDGQRTIDLTRLEEPERAPAR
jgi:transcriptional regulator with XRE-family HTH domain